MNPQLLAKTAMDNLKLALLQQATMKRDSARVDASESHILTIDAGAGRLYGEDVSAGLLQYLQLRNTKTLIMSGSWKATARSEKGKLTELTTSLSAWKPDSTGKTCSWPSAIWASWKIRIWNLNGDTAGLQLLARGSTVFSSLLKWLLKHQKSYLYDLIKFRLHTIFTYMYVCILKVQVEYSTLALVPDTGVKFRCSQHRTLCLCNRWEQL